MKKINEKENKLCIICNNRDREIGVLFCSKCFKEQKNYHLMDLNVNAEDYPALFEYKNE